MRKAAVHCPSGVDSQPVSVPERKFLTLWVCYSPHGKKWFVFAITLTLKLRLLAVGPWPLMNAKANGVAVSDGCGIEWAGFMFPKPVPGIETKIRSTWQQ
jgi:hypothetical protein